METESFDALTRQLSVAGSSRRVLTRTLAGALLGGAWAGVAARFGLAEPAAAKPKRHRAKPKAKHKAHPQRPAHGQAQAEGNHKRKKHHKSPAPPPPPPSPLPPLPPGCQNCNECQMCQDGACVPDPALAGVPCQGSGPHCNYCFLGQCTATEQRPCDDGFCAHRGQCCLDEKYCSDPESPLGFYCTDKTACCPGTKKCGSVCISSSGCCDADRPPCGACDTATCQNGAWVCGGTCCPDQHRCNDRSCIPVGQPCPCPDGQVSCPGAPGACCDLDGYALDTRTGRHYCDDRYWCD
jgi:hypothetical protein